MAKKRIIVWVCASLFFVYLVLIAGFNLYMYLESDIRDWLQQDTTIGVTWSSMCNSSEKSGQVSGESYFTGDKKQWRVEFGDEPGATVRGWPSKGGYYILYPCFAVEMDFLGLDRLKEAERPQNSSAADEEAHCRRMRQLGAKWWPSSEQSMRAVLAQVEDWDLEGALNVLEELELEKPALYFGWPAEGGVWVLNTTIFDATDMGSGRIHMAITMEERCKIMEELGAVYYAKPESCPLLDLPHEEVPGA